LWWRDDRQRAAHRVAYELRVGPIPKGLVVLHMCDVRRCVRISHLRLGTNLENILDRTSKGRGRNGQTKLTQSDVNAIRTRYQIGDGGVLAREFGVTAATITAIVRGETWRHIPSPPDGRSQGLPDPSDPPDSPA
jgi:hypothetical protein